MEGWYQLTIHNSLFNSHSSNLEDQDQQALVDTHFDFRAIFTGWENKITIYNTIISKFKK